jgi:hypothetical protein
MLEEFSSMLVEVFSGLRQDNCVCYCSTDGCDIATSALRPVRKERFVKSVQACTKDKIKIFTGVLDHLEICLDRYLAHLRSALRVMTFDVLGMTHTCHDHNTCDHAMARTPAPTQEDIPAVHHIDADDAQRLDDLMLEFEREWPGHHRSFLGFVENYWEPRM